LTTAASPTGLRKYIPILGWLPSYRPAWLRTDLVAGITAAAVVIPQAMAYATIAGLPVQTGLYVALLPMLVYIVLGSSRRLSVSSTSALAILTGSTLLAAVGPGNNPADYVIPAATLAFVVGVFLILASLLRLGFLADFISLPIITGFKAGIGVVIFVSQLGKILGLSIRSGSSILQTLATILGGLDQINWPTVVLAALTLAILILLPRLVPRIPPALVAVAFGIALSALFPLGQLGVALVGDIPTGLPSLSLPDLSLVRSLWLAALGIALMSFTESTAAARAFREHGEPLVDANRELFALGAANIAGGLFQAYPAGGGTSQTAVNTKAGAKTQVAEMVTMGVALLTLLFLAPLIGLIPEATLGALVLVAAAGLVNIGAFRDMAQIRRTELIWAIVAFLGVITLGVLEGILVAVLISILTLLTQAQRPSVYAIGRKRGTHEFRSLRDHPDDDTFSGLLIVRTEGRLFFANISDVIDKIWALIHDHSPEPQVVILVCDAIPDIEYTALASLSEFEEQLRDAGISLWLAMLNPEVLPVVRRAPLGDALGEERIYARLVQAIEAFSQRLDH
jgi:SulP family sulfate permease